MAQKNIFIKNHNKKRHREILRGVLSLYMSMYMSIFQQFLAEKFWSIQTNTHKYICTNLSRIPILSTTRHRGAIPSRQSVQQHSTPYNAQKLSRHKGQNSTGTRCCGFLALESRCRGYLVLESPCRGFLSSEKMPWNHDVMAYLSPFLDVVVFWSWNLNVVVFWV